MPCIDRCGKTLLLTGVPNVGKSSFMAKVVCAIDDVQPCALTAATSVMVGQADFKCNQWQVVDTAGILDHSALDGAFSEVAQAAVAALADLPACVVLFFMDISGECGATIAQQLALFRTSIRPCFTGKPLVVVLNKQDVCSLQAVSHAEREAVVLAIADAGATCIETSVRIDGGADAVKTLACSMLP